MEIHTKIDAQSENFKILEIHENRIIFWAMFWNLEEKKKLRANYLL